MSSHRTWMRPLNLTVVAAAAAWALWRMGAALPLPRGVARHEVDQWLREQGAPAATFAIARVGALVFAVYATGLGMLAMLAALTRRRCDHTGDAATRPSRRASAADANRCGHDHRRNGAPGRGADLRRSTAARADHAGRCATLERATSDDARARSSAAHGAGARHAHGEGR